MPTPVFGRSVANNFQGAIGSDQTIVVVTGALNGITGFVTSQIEQTIVRVVNISASQSQSGLALMAGLPQGMVRIRGLITAPSPAALTACSPGSITCAAAVGCTTSGTPLTFTFLGAAAAGFRLQIGDPGVVGNDGLILFFHEITYQISDMTIP